MKLNKSISLIVLLVALIKIVQNQAGMASAWQSFKSTASSTVSKITNVAAKPVATIKEYYLSPRELANAAIQSTFPSMPSIPSVSDATQYVANKVAHQLDPLLIPKLNSDNLFRRAPATVRVGTDLPLEEQLITEKRLALTRTALAKFIETDLPDAQNLRIGFCGSGGGYRAMLSTVGFLVGAHRTGLLDTVLYMSALSGSTWALGPWTSMNIPIDQYKNQLIAKTQNMVGLAGKDLLPPPPPNQLYQVLLNTELKYLFHQPISSVDLWGAMIANKLFEPWPNRQNIYLSNQRNIVADGKHIFPIYTAVHPQENLKYDWFEFTPFEAGSTDLRAFTPTWAFGRKFLKGKAVSTTTLSGQEFAPEQTLGFYLGIFGSAFTVNLEEVLNMMKEAEDVSDKDYEAMALKVEVIEKLASTLAGIKDLRRSRISPAKVFNYTYGLNSSPLKDDKQITLVDAGLAFNLPTPPLLRPERALDVIFIFDSSADIGMAGELKKAERHAKTANLPFPAIDYSKAKTQAISVFRDEHNPRIPTIIYMPLIKDFDLPSIRGDHRFVDFDPKACVEKDYCSTFNFKYEAEEFATLTLLTEINVTDNIDLIKNTFREILALKYS